MEPMRDFLALRSFSTRLLVGLIGLILLTTLSAGIPAYAVTRGQLERQAWSQVESAQQATASLLAAEAERLRNLSGLFGERPTLRRLVAEGPAAELEPYLRAFQVQSSLDILLYCDASGRPLAGDVSVVECSAAGAEPYTRLDDRAAILIQEFVYDESSSQLLGAVWAGTWLDADFMHLLAADTRAEQSILAPGGMRLATSLTPPGPDDVTNPQLGRARFSNQGESFFATYSPLVANQASLYSEVALPVGALMAAEARALLILAISTGLITLFALFVGVWLVRQLVAPLEDLTGAAEAISGGDLIAPIPLISEPTEISTLAAALHRSQASMLAALDERSRARDWLNTLVQSITEGVATINQDGVVTFFSEGAERVTGWSHGVALGRHVNEVLATSDDKSDFLDQLPESGGRKQIAVLAHDGRTLVLAVTVATIAGTSGQAEETALVLRDVTAEESLRHSRSYFLANISHEFRTPLSTLLASMELMLHSEEQLTAQEMRQLLKPSYVSLQALQTLIDNLLESSSIEAGRFIIYPRRMDVLETTSEAVRLCRPILERRAQAVEVVCEEQLPEIEADRARVLQAIVNLLNNASKYSPEETTVQIRLQRVDGALRISVADSGPGVPKERLHLFEQFVRAEGSLADQYGIGLGLYVVKSTAAAHGGQVGVDANVGGGSVFWFELPIEGAEGVE